MRRKRRRRHPFGELLLQHLKTRGRHVNQAELADGIDQDASLISMMCYGDRLKGERARSIVLRIIDWLHAQDLLVSKEEADALLDVAGHQRLTWAREEDHKVLELFERRPDSDRTSSGSAPADKEADIAQSSPSHEESNAERPVVADLRDVEFDRHQAADAVKPASIGQEADHVRHGGGNRVLGRRGKLLVLLVTSLVVLVSAVGDIWVLVRVERSSPIARVVGGERMCPGPTPTSVGASKPGGLWVSPIAGTSFDVTGAGIPLVARAYRTGPCDPAISRVDFTVSWSSTGYGGYTVACSAYQPVHEIDIPAANGIENIPQDNPFYSMSVRGSMVRISTRLNDLYVCLWAPSNNGSWPDLWHAFSEDVYATFNVFSRGPNHNNAPNGGRMIHVIYRKHQP